MSVRSFEGCAVEQYRNKSEELCVNVLSVAG